MPYGWATFRAQTRRIGANALRLGDF